MAEAMPGADAASTASDRAALGAAGLELERCMPYRLSVLSKRTSLSFARAYGARFGLTIPAWRATATPGRFHSRSACDVAGHARMDEVKVSRAVAAMVGRGLLIRAADAQDQRVSRLRRSERGHVMHREIATLALAWEARPLESLSRGQRRQLDGMLRRLDAQLDRIEAEGASA